MVQGPERPASGPGLASLPWEPERGSEPLPAWLATQQSRPLDIYRHTSFR